METKPELKTCNKCNNKKSLDKFYFRNDSKKYDNTCKKCRNEQNKIYVSLNKEKKSLYQKQYRKDNEEKLKKQHHEYYLNNKEHMREVSDLWMKNNPERYEAYQKQYRIDNKERIKERDRIYYVNNREAILAYANNYKKENEEVIKERAKERRDALTPEQKKEQREKRGYKLDAKEAVRLAKRSGKIVEAECCELCSSKDFIIAHHESYLYRNWLNVKWWCAKCHVNYHVENKMHVVIFNEEEILGNRLNLNDRYNIFSLAADNYLNPEPLLDISEKELFYYNKVVDYIKSLQLNIVSIEYGLIDAYHNLYGFNIIEYVPRLLPN